MISELTKLISICSTVNKDLQGIHTKCGNSYIANGYISHYNLYPVSKHLQLCGRHAWTATYREVVGDLVAFICLTTVATLPAPATTSQSVMDQTSYFVTQVLTDWNECSSTKMFNHVLHFWRYIHYFVIWLQTKFCL